MKELYKYKDRVLLYDTETKEVKELDKETARKVLDSRAKDGRYDNYYGEEEANKYGAKIIQALRGKIITKRRDKSNQPGGLEYEAKKLGIDMWDFLRALEGLCYQGKAEETSDSTYRIKDSIVKDILEIYDDTLIIVTDEKNRVVYKGIVDYAPKEIRDGRWRKGANNKTFTINTERGVLTVKVLDSSVRDSITEDALSKFVQSYLSTKKVSSKTEQDEIIKFLLERNKITTEDIPKVRELLKIIKDSLTEDSVGVKDAISESQALENFKRFLKKHYEYTDEDLKKARVELVYALKSARKAWYGFLNGRDESHFSLDGKKWEDL